jgi:MFS family permease
VAGAAGLTLWTAMFHLSSSTVGLIEAISSNAISAGIGALVGGRLCDKFGRKKIYQWDMLLYAFGLLFIIIFSSASWMLLVRQLIAGLAVGADVPASWTLIAELAPDGARGRHSGVAQVLWYCGPVIVLLLSLAMSSLGVLGIRIVFAHLFVLSICLWFARRRMRESEGMALPFRPRHRARGGIGRFQSAGAAPASRWPAQLGFGLLPIGPRAYPHPLGAYRRPVHLRRRNPAERDRQRADPQCRRRPGARRRRPPPAGLAAFPGAAGIQEAVFEVGSGTHQFSGPPLSFEK